MHVLPRRITLWKQNMFHDCTCTFTVTTWISLFIKLSACVNNNKPEFCWTNSIVVEKKIINIYISIQYILFTCILRSWVSCLRRSVAFCCRPCRLSCICRRPTLFTGVVLEGGGGIRARGADGVWAANHRAGHGNHPKVVGKTNWLVFCVVLWWDLKWASMTHVTNSNTADTALRKRPKEMYIYRKPWCINTHWNKYSVWMQKKSHIHKALPAHREIRELMLLVTHT